MGVRISRDRLPPGGQPVHGWLAPWGATCPGGKINWDTGIVIALASSVVANFDISTISVITEDIYVKLRVVVDYQKGNPYQ